MVYFSWFAYFGKNPYHYKNGHSNVRHLYFVTPSNSGSTSMSTNNIIMWVKPSSMSVVLQSESHNATTCCFPFYPANPIMKSISTNARSSLTRPDYAVWFHCSCGTTAYFGGELIPFLEADTCSLLASGTLPDSCLLCFKSKKCMRV